ncbi:hypothetical protein [Alteribacillus sp. YIM 98480]|uniref:hypothetical protein n=1 Tax=Alteribacillus sp. YIM 98480 TaxID=2606599 RepID=UPI0018EF15DA|nr:hypothetical protein [Alteribacillus sp. YIM 98480]
MPQNEKFEDYSAADLEPGQLERLRSLENELRETTNQDIILIAYEENEAETS